MGNVEWAIGTEWDPRTVDQKKARLLCMFCCRVKWEMIWNSESCARRKYMVQNVVDKELGEVGDNEMGKIMTLHNKPTEFYMKLLYNKKPRRNKNDYAKREIMRKASNIMLWIIFGTKHAMKIEF